MIQDDQYKPLDPEDPYIIAADDPRDQLLRNKLDTRDPDYLDRQEKFVSSVEIDKIRLNPSVLGAETKPDQQFLQTIHKFIFKDIYHAEGEHQFPIAGALRKMPIHKYGDPAFPDPNDETPGESLQGKLDTAFTKLETADYLKNLDKDTFINKLTESVTDIWGAHAFREGNSRCMAVFTEQLALKAGHKLQPIGKDFRQALKTSVKDNNPEPLKAIIQRAFITEKQRHHPQDTKEAIKVINSETDKNFKNMMQPHLDLHEDLKSLVEALKHVQATSAPGPETSKMAANIVKSEASLKTFERQLIQKGRNIKNNAEAKARKDYPAAAKMVDKHHHDTMNRVKQQNPNAANPNQDDRVRPRSYLNSPKQVTPMNTTGPHETTQQLYERVKPLMDCIDTNNLDQKTIATISTAELSGTNTPDYGKRLLELRCTGAITVEECKDLIMHIPS